MLDERLYKQRGYLWTFFFVIEDICGPSDAHLKPSDGGSAATQCEDSTLKPSLKTKPWGCLPRDFAFSTLIVILSKVFFSTELYYAMLTGIHSAIKMLNSRVCVIHQYLVAMQKGLSIYEMLHCFSLSLLR
jgi:hypothetical protein